MPDPMTDDEAQELAELDATDTLALLAEVRRRRAEREVMLNVIEAAEAADMTCHCIGSGGTNQLPRLIYECASHRFDKALTRFRNPMGGYWALDGSEGDDDGR